MYDKVVRIVCNDWHITFNQIESNGWARIKTVACFIDFCIIRVTFSMWVMENWCVCGRVARKKHGTQSWRKQEAVSGENENEFRSFQSNVPRQEWMNSVKKLAFVNQTFDFDIWPQQLQGRRRKLLKCWLFDSLINTSLVGCQKTSRFIKSMRRKVMPKENHFFACLVDASVKSVEETVYRETVLVRQNESIELSPINLFRGSVMSAPTDEWSSNMGLL